MATVFTTYTFKVQGIGLEVEVEGGGGTLRQTERDREKLASNCMIAHMLDIKKSGVTRCDQVRDTMPELVN